MVTYVARVGSPNCLVRSHFLIANINMHHKNPKIFCHDRVARAFIFVAMVISVARVRYPNTF